MVWMSGGLIVQWKFYRKDFSKLVPAKKAADKKARQGFYAEVYDDKSDLLYSGSSKNKR